MQIINQYSFVLGAALVGLGLIAALWRLPAAQEIAVPVRVGIIAAFAVLMLVFGAGMRYPTEQTASALDEFDAALNNGRPTFVMLYSNY